MIKGKMETDHTPTAFAAPLLWEIRKSNKQDVENKNKWGMAKNSPTQHKKKTQKEAEEEQVS